MGIIIDFWFTNLETWNDNGNEQEGWMNTDLRSTARSTKSMEEIE